MANHFEPIGFELADENEFASLVERALRDGETHVRADGGVSALWRDESGASLAVHVDEDATDSGCVAPSFAATARVPVRVSGIALDPECRFCSALVVEVLEDGEMIYPLALQLENIDEALGGSVEGRETELVLAAFAETVEIWPDEASYEAAADQEVPLGSQSLIPTGLFVGEAKRRGLLRRKGPEPQPQPYALVTGIVEKAESVVNATSGVEFIHARVATYGPVLDVLLAAKEVSAPLQPGNVIQASCWLIGRLLGQAPEVAS